jgi:choline dehydrogenase-like flavoprotein
MRRERADVCVIGTGAGGAPVARALAEAGASVTVLEEGGAHPVETMTGRPRDMMQRIYRDAGQTATIGNPPIILPLGRTIGGSTLVNSGTCFRAPDHVRRHWREQLDLDLPDAPYEQVEREIHVTRVTEDIAGRNALVAKRGAEALGWSGRFLDRNARGCQGSGVCAFGCPTGAKQHTGVTYMKWAQEAGARVHGGVKARRIEGRTVLADGLRVEADRIVVACGTLHTPGLLRRSGIRHPALGRNLSIHPATGAWALMDEEVDMARGVPQSYCVDEFASEGIMFEGVAGPPDYLAMAVPYVGRRHRELMLRYRNVAQFGLMVSDTSRGRVRGPIVRYDLNRRDAATIERGIVRLAELLFAAGAKSVFVPVAGVRELTGGDVRPLEQRRIRRRDLKLMAFHPLGTARAGRGGVLDSDLRVRGTERVYVSDGSAVPTALGVNPQMTIMALATRLGEHLCRS